MARMKIFITFDSFNISNVLLTVDRRHLGRDPMKIQDRANVWSGEHADVHLKLTNVCKGKEIF